MELNHDILDEYLKEIGGVYDPYRQDTTPVFNFPWEFGPGWSLLVRDCLKELVESGWDKQLLQVKEKFGTLRVYTLYTNDALQNIIAKYEKLSGETCESCGGPGELIVDRGWWSTVCDKHLPVGYEPEKEDDR